MRPGPAGRNPERSRLWAARMTSAFRRAPRVPFRTDEKEPKVRLRTLRLGRPARAAPGARYARRPLAGAPPRDPGLSPLRGPGPVGRILYKDGLRPNPLDPRAASDWPAAKVGGAPSTDERTGVQHPARRRAAGAMPLPVSLRNRTGSSHRGGAAAFISLACPTGRRKTARLRRARAQGARTPGTGVVFRRVSPASLPIAVVESASISLLPASGWT